MTPYARMKLQAAFFRKIVRQIAGLKRHTIEQRLAASALSLWEEIENYRRHRRSNTPRQTAERIGDSLQQEVRHG